MRTVIYLCRHGEVYNPKQVIYGRMPGFPLSEEGRKQAHALGKHLSDKKLKAIYASPLERARETATIVGSYHNIDVTQIRFDDRLIEVGKPNFEGLPIEEGNKIHWNYYQPKFTTAGGESMLDIWKRMKHALEEIAKNHKGEEIAVVSHGDPIMISRAKYSGKKLVIQSIRGEYYVPTAKGVALMYDEIDTIEVRDLEF